MKSIEDLTAQRHEHLRQHTSGSTATAVARDIAGKLDFHASQEGETLRALRRALKNQSTIDIELCLQVEHTRGLAHGVIYREIAAREMNRLPQLERQFGALPLSVDGNGNGNGNGSRAHEENGDTEPCTLVNDIASDFTHRLLRAALERGSLPARSATPASHKRETVSAATARADVPLNGFATINGNGTDILRRDGVFYRRHSLSTQQLVPLLIPDEHGKTADRLALAIEGAGTVIVCGGKNGLHAESGAVIESSKDGWVLLLPLDRQELLEWMVPAHS